MCVGIKGASLGKRMSWGLYGIEEVRKEKEAQLTEKVVRCPGLGWMSIFSWMDLGRMVQGV